MKYSITISFFILCLVVATQIVDTVNSQYYDDRGRYIFGYSSGVNAYAYARTLDKLDTYKEDNINGTVYGYISPSQQPTSTGIFVWIDQWIKSLKGVGVLFSTLFYLSIGFGQYINNLFYMPLGGRMIFNDVIVLFMGIAVCINHFIAVIGYIRGIPSGD